MAFGASAQKQPFSFGNSFGGNTQTQQSNPPFGASRLQPPQQQQSSSNLFGLGPTQQPQQSAFGGSAQQQQGGLFGQSTQQQAPQQQQPRPFGETLQYGQSVAPNQSQGPGQQQQNGPLTSYRSIPAQLQSIQSKWNPEDFSSPFRTYLYHNVEKEEESVKYQPDEHDDVKEWEKAVERRPGPTYVPRLFLGFGGLAQRAQTQQAFLVECHEKLVAINSSLEVQLDRHRQFIATRIAESRRRHERIAQRTLALAVKTQILRNKGYVMDNAEEEVREKLVKLEKEVFDPTLNGREQEIWARMLEIRERAKQIRQEMEKIVPAANGEDTVLSEETVMKAKKVLEDYDKKLQFLRRELEVMQRDYETWEKASEAQSSGAYRRR